MGVRLMISRSAGLSRRFAPLRTCGLGMMGLALSALPMAAQEAAYDGPIFAKGLWRFDRSLEVNGRSAMMPNAKRLRVDRPAIRCVDPTEAMKETFRPVSVGNCHSSSPQKHQNTYHFANRCDHLGPVRTTIVIEGPTSYRETNELKNGAAGRKEVVVARRLGECGNTPDLANRPTQLDPHDPSSYYEPYYPSHRPPPR